MSDILQKILATKRREVVEAKASVPMADMVALAKAAPPTRDFVGAIREKQAAGRPAVIAEIKKASPSVGVFRSALPGNASTFDPAKFAQSYERHGAACLSVLTDREYFQGSTEDLIAARAACRLPILRKDFIIDPYQIFEARAMGADAVLFIMGAAPITHFLEWEAIAASLGMGVLAESHDAGQLQQALLLKNPLIGINNRDLTRFTTDIATTLTLKSQIPPDRILVTESGITDACIVLKMCAAGVGAYLIGGALMGAVDPGAELASLFAGTPL